MNTEMRLYMGWSPRHRRSRNTARAQPSQARWARISIRSSLRRPFKVNRTRRVQRDFTARFMADLLASGLVGGGARAGFRGSPGSGGLCPGYGKVWTAPVSGLLAVGMGFVTRWFQGGVSEGPYGYTRKRPAAGLWALVKCCSTLLRSASSTLETNPPKTGLQVDVRPLHHPPRFIIRAL